MLEKTPQKPTIPYFLIILLALMLLNSILIPTIAKPKVSEVDYNTFLKQLESGQISEVVLDGERLYYTAAPLDPAAAAAAAVPDLSPDGVLEDRPAPVQKKEPAPAPKKEPAPPAAVPGKPAAATGKTDTAPKMENFVTGAWQDPELVDRLHAKGVKFTRVVPHETSPIVNFLLSWVLPLLFFIFIGQLLARGFQKSFGGRNTLSFGKSNAKIYAENETGKTFDDVAGQDEAKEALLEIVDFLHFPEKYTAIGATLPKGALLVGPPGTGKTLLARAVAGEAKVPFFSISGSEFVEMFVGMGAAKVRDLFKQASEKAPCIIFIDEIDTIGKKRDSGGMVGGNDEREQTLNQLLAEMDGFDGRKGVVILAATNRPESLDPALLRPGRFDRRIPVELPDLVGREAILKVHVRTVKMAPDIDLNLVARATAGASGADLENIINEGALRAVREKRDRVTQEDLMESVEVVIAGYQRKNAVISPEEKKLVSYHEIGHALVAAKMTDAAPVHKITIVPRSSGALGYTMQVDEKEHYLLTLEQMQDRIATLAGGRSAEEVVFATRTSGASNDIEQMTKMARAMVARFGMTDEFDMTAMEVVGNRYLGGDTSLACSPETGSKIDAKVIEIVREAHRRAKEILEKEKDSLHTLADYLMEKETITGEEFMSLLKENEAKRKS